MGYLIWGASAWLLIFAAHAFSRLLFPRVIDRCVAAPILVATILVASGELLSLAGKLSCSVCWMAASVLFAALAFALPRVKPETQFSFAHFWNHLPTAGRCMLAAYTGIFLVALLLPPNTWDAMSYHLARIGYYLQNNSLNHFITNNPRQVEFPTNGTVVILWTIVFTRSDALAGLVQFFAAIGCAISIYGIAISLGLKKTFAALCPLLMLGMPEIGLQASSTQNDLLAAWMLSAAVHFSLRDARAPSLPTAVLTALSAGLAAGTKPTTWFFAPGLALLWLAVARTKNTLTVASAVRAAGLVMLAVALFAGPHMLRNHAATGHAISQEPSVRVEKISTHTVAANVIRLSADLFEANDWPYPLNRAFGVLKQKAAGAIFSNYEWTNPPAATFPGNAHEFKGNILQEDVSWFGSVGFILWAAACLGMFFSKRNAWTHRAYLTLPLGFFFLFAILLRWQPWTGRLFVSASVLIVPAGVYGLRLLLRPFSRSIRRTVWHSLAALSVCGAFVVLIQNEIKPLIPRKNLLSVFSLTRDQNRCRHRPYNAVILEYLRALPPARVGFVADLDQWDHLAFVPDYKHRIIRYDATVTPAAVARDKCDLLLIQNNFVAPSTFAGFEVVPLNDYWSAVRVSFKSY